MPEKDKPRKKVNQNGKIHFELRIKDLPWTEKQKKLIETALDKKTRVIFLKGKAGTSKTILATYSALHLLNSKRISEIIFVRAPVESSDSKLGHLPGDVDDKIRYYNLPFVDKLEELLNAGDIHLLHDNKRVMGFPINFARGMHWAAKVVIVDEAQNLTKNELKTLLTRLGEFTRMFILADPEQSDLPSQKQGGFEYYQEMFNDNESRENGIYSFEFGVEDIMRSELLRYIISKMDAAPKINVNNGNGNKNAKNNVLY